MSPAFATVGINGRVARKHYGLNAGHKYSAPEDDHTKRVWDAYAGYYQVFTMNWFIKKVLIPYDRAYLGCFGRADRG